MEVKHKNILHLSERRSCQYIYNNMFIITNNKCGSSSFSFVKDILSINIEFNNHKIYNYIKNNIDTLVLIYRPIADRLLSCFIERAVKLFLIEDEKPGHIEPKKLWCADFIIRINENRRESLVKHMKLIKNGKYGEAFENFIKALWLYCKKRNMLGKAWRLNSHINPQCLNFENRTKNILTIVGRQNKFKKTVLVNLKSSDDMKYFDDKFEIPKRNCLKDKWSEIKTDVGNYIDKKDDIKLLIKQLYMFDINYFKYYYNAEFPL